MERGARTGQGSVATHEEDQRASEIKREQGHGDGRHKAPHDERVPLPLPDFADQPPGMMAQVLDLPPGHRQAAGMKDMNAQLDKWDEQKQVKRRYRLCTDLRGDLTQSKGPGEQDDKQCGKPYRRVDAEYDAQGEAPRQAARCDAAA